MFTKFTEFDKIPKDQAPKALELKEGGWVLDDSKDIDTLKQTVINIRTERDTFEKDWKAEKTNAENNKRELDAQIATNGKSKEDVAAMLKQWQTDTENKVKAAVEEKDKEIAKLSGRVTKYDLDDKLTEKFMANKGREERKARALTQAKADGWVLEGETMVRKDSKGVVMTQSADDYFAELANPESPNAFPELFKGSQANGGGAGGSNTGTAPGGDAPAGGDSPTKWTADQRRTFIETKGQPAYRALLDAELVKGATPQPKAPVTVPK